MITKKFKQNLKELAILKVIGIIAGIIILLFAHFIGVYLRGLVIKSSKKTQKNYLAYTIIGQAIYVTVLIIGLIIVLQLIGIEATSLIAILGTTGIAIGLALQGTLTDISSGILLALFQPYHIGDIVTIDEIQGQVISFNIMHTILQRTDTMTTVTIPNRTILDSPVENHSTQGYIYIIIEALLSNKTSDFEAVLKVFEDEVNRMPVVLKEPAPVYGVADMSEVGTKIRVKLAIKSDDFPTAVPSIKLQIRQALAREKVELVDPY